MAQHPLRDSVVVALASHRGAEALVRRYAGIIGGRRNPRIRVYLDKVGGGSEADCDAAERAIRHKGLCPVDLVRKLGKSVEVGFLIADWTKDIQRLQQLLHCAVDLDVPAIFVRQTRLSDIRRVLVATGGGPHTLQQMWVAKEISNALSVHMQVVRFVCREAGDNRKGDTIENWGARLLGVKAELQVLTTPDLVEGITQCVREGDLLVMGAPSPFHVGERFNESIPAAVACRTQAPIIMMNAKRPDHVTLRGVFWGQLVQAGIRPRGRQAVIEALIDALIRHHQVPASARTDLIERALRREDQMTTAVDCQTAFPHIRLPGFGGVAGSMAVCPQGVDFGSLDGLPTHFFFLLITPDGFCDEYLSIQAQISRRMIRPEVRAALLECTTPAEVLAALDPRSGKLVATGNEG